MRPLAIRKAVLAGAPNPLLFRYSTGDSTSTATFSRASTATYTNASGVIQTAGSGALRDGHYINGVRTTLLEGSRTNLLLRSSETDNAAWVKANYAATVDAIAAPDGLTTADTLTASAASHSVYQLATVTASTTYTASWWVKRGTLNDLRYAFYDATAGAFITSATSYYAETSADWVRISKSVTTPVGCIALRVYLDTGTLNGTVHFWGAQLEAGSFASSYIPTTSATVTRAADALSFPFTHAPQEMTSYIRGVEQGTILLTGNTSGLIGIGTGTGGPYYSIRQVSNTYRTGFHNGTASIQANPVTIPSIGDTFEHVGNLRSDSGVQAHISINGGVVASSGIAAGLGFMPAYSVQQLAINTQNLGAAGYMAFRDILIYKGTRDMTYMRGKV